MKIYFWTFLLLIFFLLACSNPKENTIPNSQIDLSIKIPETNIVLKSALQFDQKSATWSLDSLPYSGFVVTYHPNKTLKEKFGVLKGKKHDKFIQWYTDGHYKNSTDYHMGKVHGEKKLWSDDSTHVLIAHFKYQNGKPHGLQKKWYATGELFKKINLNNGKEEGIQQAFRKNGDLYSNYEAKEGRIFGLKKAALCYTLEDENIKKKK